MDIAEFGTLALCSDNKPYSLPINFVQVKGEIVFHGSNKGKKIEIIKENNMASFSCVESYSILSSYFSTDSGDASPATHFFKSIIIDGSIEFITDYKQKEHALEKLMQKYQKEGKYTPLSDAMYKRMIPSVCMYKLVPKDISAKFKFGQNFMTERFDRVVQHLKERGSNIDLLTIKLMKELYKEKAKH